MAKAKKVELNQDELPDGWVASTLGDIASYIQRGKSPKYTEFSKLPVVNQKCVRWYGIDREYLKYIHPDQFEKWEEKRYLQNGDLLWNSTGTGTIGRAAIVLLKEGEKLVADSHVTIVRSGEGMEPKYVHYWVMGPAVQNSIEAMQSGSTNQVELSKGAVESTPIPVAPPEQQKRIVAKIEELFSHIDAGIEALKKAKQLLKQYRQSVLKAAVTGELTKEWREENKDKLEPASQLLERILIERRQKWEEQQLKQFKAKGKIPKNDKWKEKYKKPFSIEDDQSMWVTMKVGDIFDCIVPNRDKPESFSGDIAWVTTPVINEETASIDYEECELGLTDEEVEKYNARLVPENSVIMTCVGRFGITAVAEKKCVINQQLHCFLPSNHYSPKLLAYFLQEKEKFMESIATATTVQYMNKTNCNSIPIPIMSRIEQIEILVQVERRLSGIERLSKEIDKQAAKVEMNKQSILASAFSGNLSIKGLLQ